MVRRRGFILAALVMSNVTAAASADVKAGIDAYQRGDFATAVSTWLPLANAGDADAQYNMGQAYRLGRGVPVDSAIASSWFKKAADQGHPRARNAYGLTLFQDGRRMEAVPYIEESAGHGFPQAQYVFATLLFNGDMVEKDWVRSYALMTRAAAGDVAAAKAGLAQLDTYIPEEQRKRGLKLAQMFEANNATSAATDTTAPVIAAEAAAPSLTTKVKPVAAAKPQLPKHAVPKPVIAKPPLAVATVAVTSTPRPALGGTWRVQLGAFSNGSAASALWNKLHGSIAALGPYQSFIVPAGKITRLQAGPLATRAAAEKLCTSVKAAGNACLSVAP